MEKILIVDDSVTQAAKLKSILEDEYEVTVAQTAIEGLSFASTGKFSLILLDVVMPEMDGFMLLKKLQEEIITQSVPVILITSLSDIENEQHGFMLGAVDYITKPFHPVIVKAFPVLQNGRKRPGCRFRFPSLCLILTILKPTTIPLGIRPGIR